MMFVKRDGKFNFLLPKILKSNYTSISLNFNYKFTHITLWKEETNHIKRWKSWTERFCWDWEVQKKYENNINNNMNIREHGKSQTKLLISECAKAMSHGTFFLPCFFSFLFLHSTSKKKKNIFDERSKKMKIHRKNFI